MFQQQVKKELNPANLIDDEPPTIWKQGTPCAVAYRTQGYGSIKSLVGLVDDQEEHELYVNELPAKIFEPEDGDVYLFKNVTSFKQISLIDGYTWRCKGKRKLAQNTVMLYLYAEAEVRGVNHHRFVKNIVFNQQTQRIAVQYKGNREFSNLNRAVLAHCSVAEIPRHRIRRVPFSECFGPSNSLAAYKRLLEEASSRGLTIHYPTSR